MRLLTLLAAFLATPVLAGALEVGALSIEAPYAFATPPTARAGAGYLAITNRGGHPETLEMVRTETGEATIHRTETGADGVARMRAAEGLVIGPGETLRLEPGALHVMFTGLEGPLVEGESVDAVLVFQEAGDVPVVFDVVARDSQPAHQH